MKWATLWLAAFLAFPTATRAQQYAPQIGFVFPAGGQRGTTFRVTVGGRHLKEVSRAYITGSGVQAAVMPLEKTMSNTERQAARAKVSELLKGERNADAQKQLLELAKMLSHDAGLADTKLIYPVLAETVTIEVTLSADAAAGCRELRLETRSGLSNPLRFCVGCLPEFRKQEQEVTAAFTGPATYASFLPPRDMDVTLPALINGQIIPRRPDPLSTRPGYMSGDVDRYRFQARKGQQLVIAVSAQELIPYLGDAVPGWFQATLSLFDAKGKKVAYDDDWRFHPDPVLYYKVREDGPYVIEIKDAIYRGRPDFVYRIAAGELPFITSIFPLGGRAGEQTSVELSGWNLPVERLAMDARVKAPGVFPLSVEKGDMLSNVVPFAVDTLPECLEKEPNDSLQTAQPVALPVIINGRIDRPGDRDVFRFEGRAAEEIVAEVIARRLDSPLDSVLKLTDAAGKRLAFNDDYDDKGDGLHTHQADSLIHFTLPADGTYYVHLWDAQHAGGPEYAYRLRLSAPRPDFALRVAPSGINAHVGKLTPITVFALRKDGFSGEIALRLKDVPEGFSLGGGLIPAGQEQVRVTLVVQPLPSAKPISLTLEGRATIAGKTVVHAAVPAEDVTQAFFNKHLVPAEELKIVMVGGSKNQASGGSAARDFQPPMSLMRAEPVKIPAGRTAEVRIAMPGNAARGGFEVELSDPPPGIAIERVSRVDKGVTILLRGDAEKTKAGLKGNLIATAYEKTTTADKKGKTREVRVSLGTLPAIPFEIVP